MKRNYGFKMMRAMVLVAVLIMGLASALALDVSINDYDPKPAEAGKAVNVWVKIDNPLNDPEANVYVELQPKDGLMLTPGEEARQSVGIVPARDTQVIQYRLLVKDDAFEGSHTLDVSIFRGTSSSAEATKTLTIQVTDKDFKDINLAVGDVESDPSRIKPDDENIKLDVTLQNLGDGKAQGVKAELVDLPEGITLAESYSGTSLLGNVEADSTSLATFYLDVDESVKPAEYTAYISTSYKYKPDEDEDDYVFEQKRIPLNIAVKPVPLYEITNVELLPGELTAGDQDVKIKITVKNIGEETGESVRLKVYGKTEQPFEFDESSDFVSPELKPGEEGQGTLRFDVEKDANLQNYYLDLEIKNVVNEDVLTYNKKVLVPVTYPMPNNPWKLYMFGVAAIVLVGGYVLFTRIRANSKPKRGVKKVKGKYGKNYLNE